MSTTGTVWVGSRYRQQLVRRAVTVLGFEATSKLGTHNYMQSSFKPTTTMNVHGAAVALWHCVIH
jgi:hypothetical protein